MIPFRFVLGLSFVKIRYIYPVFTIRFLEYKPCLLIMNPQVT